MRLLLTALAIVCATAPAAFAQVPAPAAADPVILRVETGSVMVSQQGAEFVTVESDVSLQPQDRVLVPEGTVASLDYGQGCSVALVTGAYPVAASCPLATAQPAAQAAVAPAETTGTAAGAAAAGGTNTVLIVGGVAAAIGIAAAAGGGGSDSPPPPVSR